jgi:hypothetical protein
MNFDACILCKFCGLAYPTIKTTGSVQDALHTDAFSRNMFFLCADRGSAGKDCMQPVSPGESFGERILRCHPHCNGHTHTGGQHPRRFTASAHTHTHTHTHTFVFGLVKRSYKDCLHPSVFIKQASTSVFISKQSCTFMRAGYGVNPRFHINLRNWNTNRNT